jgi:Domain of unknown function DUF29
MAAAAAELYDEDFYAWTQQQANALRTHFKGDKGIDVEHLAEDVEDLGESELHAVESYIENVIEHRLKLDYSGWIQARDYRRVEVDAFGASVERKITPRIRQQVETELEVLYGRARRGAARSMHRREPDLIRRLPKHCPYDWNEIWHRDVLAEAGIDLSSGAEEGKRASRRKGKASWRSTTLIWWWSAAARAATSRPSARRSSR